MKIVLQGIDGAIDCAAGDVCSVIIENQAFLYQIVCDIENQLQGNDGSCVLSNDNKVIRMDKYAELLTQFIPFDINRKNLLNKIAGELQKIAVDENHYIQTNELLTAWESYCMDLAFGMTGDIKFSKVTAESLIKAAGVEIDDAYESLAEKLIDYFELVRAYDAEKLFVLVNLRSFLPDEMMQAFVDTVLAREYQILLIESTARPLLQKEKRVLIDADLCQIC